MDSRCRATGVVVCDNTTGDPVDMGLGPAVSELTLAIVAVNAETSDMLHSYASRPQGGEIYELFTENCPYTMNKFTSQVRGYPFQPFVSSCGCLRYEKSCCWQVLVWSIGVVTCIVATYMSAAPERRIATGATLSANEAR